MAKTMREVFGQTLADMKDNPRLVVVDADLGSATKALLFKEACPERFIDVGIAEQDMVGTAAGLAAGGMIPVCSSFAVFMAGRALDQIRNTVAHGGLNVKLVGTHGGVSVGYDGATHQAVADLSVMRAIPGLTVLCPSDARETASMVRWAVEEYQGPVYLHISRIAVPDYHREDYVFRPGKGELLRQGRDCTIVAAGIMVTEALAAAQQLAAEGIEATVVNMPSLKPLDTALLAECAQKTGAIVTAEEHTVLGGLGSAVAEAIVQQCPVPMRMVGMQDEFGESGDPERLLQAYHLKAADIAAAVRDVIQHK